MNRQNNSDTITLIGAGLVGSLLSIYLARRGFSVQIFERRPDMRKTEISAGRSINLAISERGLHALRVLGLEEEALANAVFMKGRMIHTQEGSLSLQPYSINASDSLNSISRAVLNKILMDRAEETGKVKINFNSRVLNVDLENGKLTLAGAEQKEFVHQAHVLIGTDGSASALRESLKTRDAFSNSETLLDYGYKELTIPPPFDASHGKQSESVAPMETHALHIWPRGNFMLIALPNTDHSFTCTLFLPFHGPLSFDQLSTPDMVRAFFDKYFADAVPHLSRLTEEFFAHPTGQMTTVKCGPWSFANAENASLLLGDAAHAIVPFFGQGMNCGFEDCRIFGQLLDKQMSAGKVNWADLFAELFQMRKENTDAIADMAVENFIEMRDKVANSQFVLQKTVEKLLEKKFTHNYRSRYSLVTFSNIPYAAAQQIGLAEDEILETVCQQINNAEEADFALAAKLVESKVAPLLANFTPDNNPDVRKEK